MSPEQQRRAARLQALPLSSARRAWLRDVAAPLLDTYAQEHAGLYPWTREDADLLAMEYAHALLLEHEKAGVPR